MKGKRVDLVIYNAKIHSMNESDQVYQAIAIKDGKIVELGPDRQILNKYSAAEEVDAQGKEVYPAFTDAHGHMMSYARLKCSADLVGTQSMEELLNRVEKYAQKKKRVCIVGRGWDQSFWANKELPTNEALNERFPNLPVALTRIDGHAMLCNDAMLKRAGITAETKIEGGEVIVKEGKPTGLLLDYAIEMVNKSIPDFSEQELTAALQEIETELFQYGIAEVHEAGLSPKDFKLLRRLYEKRTLKIGMYGMLYPEPENIDFAKKNGFFSVGNLTVRSFKIVGDGALGSRGACLKQPYSDDPHTHGLLTTSQEKLDYYAKIAELTGYQLNIHAIGDSTNSLVLNWIERSTAGLQDHRWRIEHAQVMDLNDLDKIVKTGVYLSVQPTHAVSDQRWAESRLGTRRLAGAYAYKTLLEKAGMLSLGTDFPVEKTDPFLTIFAAVNRKNATGDPIHGFLPKESLRLEDCLKGMTIWPATASFQENSKGTLEKGKWANLVILDQPLKVQEEFSPNFAYQLFVQGKSVYSAE